MRYLHQAVDRFHQIITGNADAVQIPAQTSRIILVKLCQISVSDDGVQGRADIMCHLEDLHQSGGLAFLYTQIQQVADGDAENIGKLWKERDIRVRYIPLPFRDGFVGDAHLVCKLRLGHPVLKAEGADKCAERHLFIRFSLFPDFCHVSLLSSGCVGCAPQEHFPVALPAL